MMYLKSRIETIRTCTKREDRDSETRVSQPLELHILRVVLILNTRRRHASLLRQGEQGFNEEKIVGRHHFTWAFYAPTDGKLAVTDSWERVR
jgi:hypothetical protein